MKTSNRLFLLLISIVLMLSLLASCSVSTQKNDQTISKLNDDLAERDHTISKLEDDVAQQDTIIEDLNEQIVQLQDDIATLTSENQKLSELYEKSTKQYESISNTVNEIPERYKDIFFDASQIVFVSTMFGEDIRVLKIDKDNNKIIDLLTDRELDLVGVHNVIEFSYGYKFTMEQFLSGETSIGINGNYYSIVGFPSTLEFKCIDGELSLYDILQALAIMRVEKNGQFIYG